MTDSQPQRQRFTRQQRLKRPADFRAIFKTARRVSDDHLILYARFNRLGRSRLGVGVGKKLGSAVVRNRYKRTLREAFRSAYPDLPAGYDLVLIPRSTDHCSSRRYKESLLTLIRRWQRRNTPKKN